MINLEPSEFDALLELVQRGQAAQSAVDAATPATSNERKQAYRERMRDAGLHRLDAWVHPAAAAAVRRYIARKNREALEQQQNRDLMREARS